jgi:hypothetical protein
MIGIKHVHKSFRKTIYDVSIEDLGLSQDAMNPLLRTGITSIGDVIDLWKRLQNPPMSGAPRGLAQHIDHIESKLIEFDYDKYYK